MRLKYLLVSFLFLFALGSMAQNAEGDTIRVDSVPKHSPTKATIMSLVVPGLGQAYNKKYWKIPLVYAAIGVPLYYALDQQKMYNEFKDAYVSRLDEDPTTVDNKYDGVYDDGDLEELIDFHRKNRDLLFVLTGVAYALNVLDAAVDAHLYYFDVSDDLSAEIKPNIQFASPRSFDPVPSLTLTLKFGKKPSRHSY